MRLSSYDAYEFKTCPICGINYAVDKEVMRYKAETKNPEKPGWYCPNGHSLVFTVREADRLRQELDRAKQQIARAEDEAREANDARIRAEKAQARTLKRIHAGTCPCCKRNFQNVARHMKTKHPNVTPLKATA